MKKRKKLKHAAVTALVAVSVLTMSACGQKPVETGANPPATSGAETTKPPASTDGNGGDKEASTPKSANAADVFKKTMEASAKLNSFTVNMNMKQNIQQGETNMDIQSKIDMDIVMKPEMAFKQVISMNTAGQDVKIDMYLTKEGFFMKDPTSGQWMKLPSEQMDQILSQVSSDQMDPAKQLEKLKQFANDFTMTESGDTYIVKLAADGEKFQDFIKQEIQNSMGGDPSMEEVLKQTSGMKISNVEYSFTIDKKTYNPKAMTVNMDLEMEIQGQKIRMVQQVEGTYANYNSVKEIVVPKEALEAQQAGAQAQ